MMANMPIFQDMTAALLTGAAKPAGAAVEGEGVDFAALLAGVETGRDSAPGQVVAASRRPDFVTAMLAQRQGNEAGNEPIVGNGGTAEPTSGPQAAILQDGVPDAGIAAGANARPAGTLADGEEPPLAIAPAPDRPVKHSTPARFAHVTSMLPQMANAVNAVPGKAEMRVTPAEKVELPVEADDQMKASPSPLAQGLALPLLQGLEPPAAAGAQSAMAAGNGADVSAHTAVHSVAARSNIPGALPQWAAQPAQIRARTGGAETDLPVDAGANAPGAGHAAAPSAHYRQALALELAVSSLGQGASGEKALAAAPSTIAKLEGAEDGVIMPSSAALAVASPAAAAHPEISGGVEMATPPAPAIAAADTGALLGEQVIDMGVEGQWIDRMAREIADISAGTGRAIFTLNPENLGRLQVEVLQRDDGADVRLIADTDEAAAALSQGRQQLQQDARLQAVRIHDVQIERAPADRGHTESGNLLARGQSMGQEMAGQQGQSQPFHKKPLIEAVSSNVTGLEQDQAASERTRSQHARYA